MEPTRCTLHTKFISVVTWFGLPTTVQDHINLQQAYQDHYMLKDTTTKMYIA